MPVPSAARIRSASRRQRKAAGLREIVNTHKAAESRSGLTRAARAVACVMSRPELEDIAFMKKRIGEAVADILRSIPPGKVDQAQASAEIIAYVFQGVDPASAVLDHARYDWYYTLLGKAVAIAQGWKINHASEVTSVAGTVASVQSYLEKTYGTTLPR